MNAIQVAIKTETDAIAFYEAAAKKTKHPVGKKMFLSIVQDEKNHLEEFTSILEGLDASGGKISVAPGKVKTVFKGSGADRLEKVRKATDGMEALRIAMQMESESIAFYKRLSARVRTPEERELFDKLVTEEQRHYAMFSNTYFFLSNAESWFMWEEHSIADGGTAWA